MGAARSSAAGLLGFLGNVRAEGVVRALAQLRLETLSGRPLDEVFLGIADVLCPEGGAIDEGIARDAFIETIADLTALGIESLDALSQQQVETVFEAFVARTIETRLFNDIGIRGVALPSDIQAVESIQTQVRDFIRGAVHDAIAAERERGNALTGPSVSATVDRIYEVAFELIRTMGEDLAQ